MYFFLSLVYSFIYTASLIFCFYRYFDKKQKTGLYILSFIIGTFTHFLIRILNGNNIIQIIFILLNNTFIIYLLNMKMSFTLLFCTSCFTNIMTFVFSFIQIIMNFISYFSFPHPILPNIILMIIITLMFLLTIYIFNKFINDDNFFNENIIEENEKSFCFINMITLLIYSLLYAFTRTLYYLNIPMQCLISSIFILWIYVIYIFNHQLNLRKQATQNILMNLIYQNIEQFKIQYQQEKEDIHKLYHDMKNNLLIIKNLDNKKDINHYIDELYPKLEIKNDNKIDISGNVYIDTILYMKKREYPQVTFIEDFQIHGLNMNSVELCTLVFNLIDNACEAAQLTNGFIDIHMSYEYPHLKIQMKNSCQDRVNFVSKKGKYHGYGMKIIQDIVHKYNGSLEYKYLDKEILVKILLVI